MLSNGLSRAINRIYAAAEGAEPWTTPLHDLRDLLRARVTSVLERRAESGRDTICESVGADPSYRASYEQYFWKRNIYMQRLEPMLRPGLVVPHESCLDDREILRSDYYQDFVRHLDIFRVVAGMTTRRDGTPVRIAVCRSKNDRPFSTNDAKILEALLPHFQRAFAIHERLGRAPRLSDRLTPDTGREAAAARDESTTRRLRRVRLTEAESAVARRLAAGQSVAEICDALRIRQTTLRTHLRHLFQKTQTRRQAELVAWLLRATD
jgi:DNA-binding CsgD family transcriptional regulator